MNASNGLGVDLRDEVGMMRLCQPGFLKSERLARVEGRPEARGQTKNA